MNSPVELSLNSSGCLEMFDVPDASLPKFSLPEFTPARSSPPGSILRGRRILVVEDEFMLADELSYELGERGVVVLGPAGSVQEATSLIRSEAHIDGAILDVNLRGEMAFPAADQLVARDVPFVFTTGYGGLAIPQRFAHVTRCEKPLDLSRIVQTIGNLIST